MISKNRGKGGLSRAPAVMAVIVLTVAALLCAFAVVTDDNEIHGEASGGIEWTISGSKLIITSGTGTTETVNESSVTYQAGEMKDYASGGAPWYGKRAGITSIEIGEGVTNIGSYAFQDFGDNLKSVTISGGLTFNVNSFVKCTSKAQFTTSKDITVLDGAFNECTYCGKAGPKSIWSGSNTDGVFLMKVCGSGAMIDNTLGSDGKPAGSSLVKLIQSGKVESSVKVLITSGITHVGAYSFYNWNRVIDFMIQSDSCTFGIGSMYGSKAEGITMSTVSYNKILDSGLSVSAVVGTTPVNHWRIIEGDEIRFSGSGNMSNYTNRLYTGWADLDPKILSFEEGSKVTTMGYNSFASNKQLTKVYLSNTIKTINTLSFYNCEKLYYVYLPDSVTSIGGTALTNCPSIERFYGTSELICDGGKLLYGDTKKTSIVAAAGKNTDFSIPYNVTSITNYVFTDFKSISSITLPVTITSMADHIFSGTSVNHIYLKGYNSEDGEFTYDESVYGVNALPPGISHIGNNLFGSDECLTDITIPENVGEIRPVAFKNCTGLQTITIPKNVNSINTDSFYGCTSLTTMYFKGDVPRNFQVQGFPPSVLSIYVDEGYYHNFITEYSEIAQKFKAIKMSDGKAVVTEAYTLYSDGMLKIDASGKIDGTMFEGLSTEQKSKVRSIILTKASTISKGAFSGMTNLYSITLPSTLTVLESGAFNSTVRIVNYHGQVPDDPTKVVLPTNPYNVYVEPEYISDMVSKYPDYKTLISSRYGNATDFRGGTITEGLYYQVYGSNLLYVYGVGNIPAGSNPSFDCSGIQYMIIGEGVTGIGSGAFSRCTNLGFIHIPSTITTIDKDAFKKKVTDKDGTSTVDSFNNLYTMVIEGTTSFTKTVGTTKELSFNLPPSLRQVYVDPSVINYYSGISKKFVSAAGLYGDVLFETDGDGVHYELKYSGELTITKAEAATSATVTNILGEYKQCVRTVTIESGITSLGEGSFQSCLALKSINLGGITGIGKNAFSSCKALVGVSIPSTVTSLGDGVFNGCFGLGEITFGEGIQITKIPANFLYNCRTLANVVIPSTVQNIGSKAFYNDVSLKSVTIPDAVAMNDTPFAGCGKLTVVTVVDSPGDDSNSLYHTLNNWSLNGQTDYTIREYHFMSGDVAPYLKGITCNGLPAASNLSSKKVFIYAQLEECADVGLYFDGVSKSASEINSILEDLKDKETENPTGNPVRVDFTCTIYFGSFIFNHLTSNDSFRIEITLEGAISSDESLGMWTTVTKNRVTYAHATGSDKDISEQTAVSDFLSRYMEKISLIDGSIKEKDRFIISDWDKSEEGQYRLTIKWPSSSYSGTVVIEGNP